jgi:hypothetical protein
MLSSVRCIHECDCDCHKKGSGTMHCAPCCDYECNICHRNIIRGMMEAHLKECHNVDYKKEKNS